MAKRKIALWLLNRVAGEEWNHARMLKALAGHWWHKNEVRLGQRKKWPLGTAVVPGADEAPGKPLPTGALMDEGGSISEYFVPIPVKCIGNPSLLGVPAGHRAELDAIQEFYLQYYEDGARYHWSKYWDLKRALTRTPSPLGDIAMTTLRGHGYYKVLQDFTHRNPGFRHVLVGYSQGGLVARHLAYLDEHLFDNQLIDGVITIESPNFGSPLARPANATNVMQTLALVAAGIAQLDAATFPDVAVMLKALALQPKSLDLPWLLALLDQALLVFLLPGSNLQTSRPNAFEFLKTARKWLSGLEGEDASTIFHHDESVFYDLDIGLLPKPGSVLNAVNAHPLRRIKHAAIVGTNNQLDALIKAGIDGYVDTMSWLKRYFARRELVKMEAPLHDNVAIASEAYRQAMREMTPPLDPEIQARVDDLQSGIKHGDTRYRFRTPGDVPAFAHDFIIPSAYQLIQGKRSDAFLGNWINPEASHLSGADPRLAGKKTQDHVLEILRQM